MKTRNICTSCLQKRTIHPFRRSFTTTSLTSSTPTSTPAPTNNQNPPPNPNKIPFKDLTPSQLSYYWDTQTPSEPQLLYADKFFAPSHHSPLKLWSASKFRTTPMSSLEPEVAFLGRSNVGKSSLLNAVMGKEICWTSSRPGRTREMNAFGIGGTKGGESKVVLLDMPGYGRASRPEWGVEIMKYLQGRRQLRRAFILIDIDHGLKKTDLDLLALFRQYAIPHQIVLSKADKLLVKNKKQKTSASLAGIDTLQNTLRDIRPIVQPDGRVEGPGALGEILSCSAETRVAPGSPRFLGISALRWAVLKAAGFAGSVEVKQRGFVASAE